MIFSLHFHEFFMHGHLNPDLFIHLTGNTLLKGLSVVLFSPWKFPKGTERIFLHPL